MLSQQQLCTESHASIANLLLKGLFINALYVESYQYYLQKLHMSKNYIQLMNIFTIHKYTESSLLYE
jgi:hypothetical protein